MTQLVMGLNQWREIRKRLRGEASTIGFVPTMGALHNGHLSLVEASRRENQVTVISIFVNPTQFNDRADLDKYPRMIEQDVEQLSRCGVDFVFAPTFDAIYRDNYRYRVSESEESKILCGHYRPGHFDGVLTVVMKLLNLVAPHRAYFGEKDFQQLELIRGMVEAFFMDVEIVACPTIREADGLAMSSRNLRLTETERQLAAEFPRILREAKTETEAIEKLSALGFRVDYVERYKDRRCAAAHLGEVRLIDNIQL
jgi:pantoate--beta-alanine ligase